MNQKSFIKRKAPRQRRAKFTFESIKIATMELVETQGFGSLSTIDIAARAGVSVGSLYQYFPNRESILLAIYEEVIGQLVEAVKADFPNIYDAPLEKGLRRTARLLLTLYTKDMLILVELPRQMPELHLDTHPVSFDRLIHGTLRMFLKHRNEQEDAAMIDHRAFFIEHILIGSIQRYLLNPPHKLSPNSFLKHVTQILMDYIQNSGQVKKPVLSRK